MNRNRKAERRGKLETILLYVTYVKYMYMIIKKYVKDYKVTLQVERKTF